MYLVLRNILFIHGIFYHFAPGLHALIIFACNPMPPPGDSSWANDSTLIWCVPQRCILKRAETTRIKLYVALQIGGDFPSARIIFAEFVRRCNSVVQKNQTIRMFLLRYHLLSVAHITLPIATFAPYFSTINRIPRWKLISSAFWVLHLVVWLSVEKIRRLCDQNDDCRYYSVGCYYA